MPSKHTSGTATRDIPECPNLESWVGGEGVIERCRRSNSSKKRSDPRGDTQTDDVRVGVLLGAAGLDGPDHPSIKAN